MGLANTGAVLLGALTLLSVGSPAAAQPVAPSAPQRLVLVHVMPRHCVRGPGGSTRMLTERTTMFVAERRSSGWYVGSASRFRAGRLTASQALAHATAVDASGVATIEAIIADIERTVTPVDEANATRRYSLLRLSIVRGPRTVGYAMPARAADPAREPLLRLLQALRTATGST